jgi:hypothetical protein
MFSPARDRAADEQNIKQHAHVHGAWANPIQLTKTALFDLMKQFLGNYKASSRFIVIALQIIQLQHTRQHRIHDASIPCITLW